MGAEILDHRKQDTRFESFKRQNIFGDFSQQFAGTDGSLDSTNVDVILRRLVCNCGFHRTCGYLQRLGTRTKETGIKWIKAEQDRLSKWNQSTSL